MSLSLSIAHELVSLQLTRVICSVQRHDALAAPNPLRTQTAGQTHQFDNLQYSSDGYFKPSGRLLGCNV